MSDSNSMNREMKKRQLRRQIVTPPSGNEEDNEESLKKARKKNNKIRLRIIVVVFCALIAGFAGFYLYFSLHQYTNYSVVWEKELKEGSYVGYVDYGSNVMKYSKDGASYLDSKGNEVWTEVFEMKSPVADVNGDYGVVADQQGNRICIFDKSGKIGEATTVLPIIKVTVSAHGVVAAILEDSRSNYIYFFKRDGTVLDVKIKALLGGEVGYPVDISLSSDGTQLMGVYAYLKNGALNGRVAFHNFDEIGKSVPDRLVGGYDEPYIGCLVAQVQFLDETYSCAFADNGVSFYSSKNELSPQLLKQVETEDEIISVFHSSNYVGLILENPEGENPQRLEIYKPDGSLVFSKAFHYQYRQADIDGDRVILYNESSCRIYNMSGRLKFETAFDFPVTKIRNGRYPNTLIVSGPQTMKEIRLH